MNKVLIKKYQRSCFQYTTHSNIGECETFSTSIHLTEYELSC